MEKEHLNTVVMCLRVKDSLESPIVCTFCDLSYYSVSDILQHHSDQHESEPPQYFQCNHCEICHQKKAYVESHSMKIHGKHFICRKCGKILDKTETYTDHLAKSKMCNLTRKKYKHITYDLNDLINDTFEGPDFEPTGETTSPPPDTKVEAMEPLDSPNSFSFCDVSSTSVIDIIQHHSEFHEDETPLL